MSSNEQIASWFRKSRKKATRLQLVHQGVDGAERLVWEWTVDDLPTSYVECSTVITEAAQTATNTAQENQSYVLRTLDDNGSVLSNLILETEADIVMQASSPDNAAAFMTVAMGQVLQHKNKDQAQQHTATAAALRVVLETNKELMHDRQKSNALLFDLLTKVFELRMSEVRPADGDEDVMKQAWAVSLDKATDGIVTHLMPAIGKVLDEGTRKLLEEQLPSKGGRPTKPGSRRERKKAQNGAKQNEQTT